MKTSNQKLIEKLREDIAKLKTPENLLLAGWPNFQDLYGRDALIASWALLDTEPEICRSTLEILAKYQSEKINWRNDEEPGKIPHKVGLDPGKAKPRYDFVPEEYWDNFLEYWSHDSTSLFVVLFTEYFKKSNDERFLIDHWRNILEAVNWIINFGDSDQDYLLEYRSRNPYGLYHHGWKDYFCDHLGIGASPIAMVEVQGYAFAALTLASFLAEKLSQKDAAKKWRNHALALKRTFNKKFWMEDERYFALALNGAKKQVKKITSNPGHLLFTDIVEKDKVGFVVERLFRDDLWTPYGIRTLSSDDPLFHPLSYHNGSIWPHDNWIIHQGLKSLGYKTESKKIKTALIGALKTLGYIPELFGVVDGKIVEIKEANPLQAWSSTALLNLLIGETNETIS